MDYSEMQCANTFTNVFQKKNNGYKNCLMNILVLLLIFLALSCQLLRSHSEVSKIQLNVITIFFLTDNFTHATSNVKELLIVIQFSSFC